MGEAIGSATPDATPEERRIAAGDGASGRFAAASAAATGVGVGRPERTAEAETGRVRRGGAVGPWGLPDALVGPTREPARLNRE